MSGVHHCILSAFLCFPHVYPLGGILVFSRVILTRVYVLRMLYTFCIHDAALAILIIIIIIVTLHPKLYYLSMYACTCVHVRTCTRIVERRALLVTFQRRPKLLFWW